MDANQPLDLISAAAADAWRQSFLSAFPDSATRALLDGARERHFAVGEIVYRGGLQASNAPVHLVVRGLVRVHVRSAVGRELTVRYASEADVIGLPTVVAGRSNRWLAVQAMGDVTLLALSGDRLRRLAASEVSVAWPIAAHLAYIVHLSEEVWSANMFQPVRARVARHLLDLSVRDADGLAVTATQDDLAHAVGSVREVVARALKSLGDAGLIERAARTIRLLDPAGLHQVASEEVPTPRDVLRSRGSNPTSP